MRRKGISPLIAAVLLIAFTMAVASLFAQWAPQLMQDAQGDTSEQAQDIQRCSDIVLEISETTEPNVTIQQTAGSQSAGEVTVTWLGSDTAQETVTMSGTRNVTTVTTTAVSASDVDSVEADPSVDCPGAPTATYTFE